MAIIIKGGTSSNLAFVDTDGALRTATRGLPLTPTTVTVPAASTGTLGPVEVSTAGNVSFIVKNTAPATPWTGAPIIVFEQSDDGVSWTPQLVVRSDTSQVLSTHVMPAGAANVSYVFDAGLEGVNWVRARVTTGTTTGALTLVAQPGGLAFSPITSATSPSRTPVVVSGVTLAVGATGVETLLTLSQQKGTGLPASATSFPVPLGRRFRVSAMVLTQVGSTTATAATTIFRLRYNAAGAVTTTSTPIMLQTRLAAPATATSFQQLQLPVPDGFELPGDGVGNFGVTVASTYVTNAPTVDVLLVGYEY